jgi:SpoIID/LytB domain protein
VRRFSRRRLLSLAAVIPAAWVPRASAVPQYPRFRPLSSAELFESRLRFRDGEPAVSIGLARGQREVTVRSERPLRLLFDEGGLPKTVFVDGEVRLRGAKLRPGLRRYWVQAERFDYGRRDEAEVVARRWRDRGIDARVQEQGVLLALQGHLLDTRHHRVWLGGSDRPEPAQRLQERLFARTGARGAIDVESSVAPSGDVDIVVGGAVRHRASSRVCITTARDAHLAWVRGSGDPGRYGGDFYVLPDHDGGLTLVNSVGAERVLAGLVPAEMFARAPMEALKAQAVTARGAILSKLGQRHFDEPFHLCGEQHCQVYAGVDREHPRTSEAVQATRGLLAVRPGSGSGGPVDLVPSVYSSTCGGASEDNDVVWDQPPHPSLRGRLDGPVDDPALRPFREGLDESNIRAWLESYPPTWESRSSFVRPDKYRWRQRRSAEELAAMVEDLDVGTVTRLEVLGRGPGGRVTGLRVVGKRRTRTVLRELPVRRRFGNLNSGMFVVDHERDASGRLVAVEFVGGGWGHGAGMCQIGAIGRAESGQTFDQILAHYYGGAVVEKLY